jgi:hypothetical protein
MPLALFSQKRSNIGKVYIFNILLFLLLMDCMLVF